MKKLLLATTAILLAAPAFAADLPRRSAAVAPAPMFVQAYSWAGFYVGAQVGYSWADTDTVIFTAPGVRFNPITYGVDADGFFGGVHAGYNFQSGAFVYGIEADIELARVNSSYALLGITGKGEMDLRGSVRARLGYAFDRALIYVTGGLAMANIENSVLIGAVRINADDTKYGWTVGAGVEYALTNNWSTRIEYRYTDLGSFKTPLAPVLPTGFTRTDITDHSVRIGLSYRFGGSARPVVARY